MSNQPAAAHSVSTEPSSNHVVVRTADGTQTIAESNGAHVLHESGKQDSWYVPLADLRVDVEPSDTTSQCEYKGDASYWNLRLTDGHVIEDGAKSYEEPLEAAHGVQHALTFHGDAISVEVDGEPVTT